MALPTGTTSRFAFYGRVWTEDAQVPSLYPRRLAACERALEPSGGEIVGRGYDEGHPVAGLDVGWRAPQPIVASDRPP